MTITERLTIALLLIKYLSSNPLSHRKRDVIAEVCASILEDVLNNLKPPIDDAGDIPF